MPPDAHIEALFWSAIDTRRRPHDNTAEMYYVLSQGIIMIKVVEYCLLQSGGCKMHILSKFFFMTPKIKLLPGVKL